MLPPFSRGGMVRRHSSLKLPIGPQTCFGSAPSGLGQKRDTAGLAKRLLARQPFANLLRSGQHADRSKEGREGNVNTRHLRRGRALARQLPGDEVRLGEPVAQESEARHDHRVAEIVGLDVDQGNRQNVAALGTAHTDRPGHGVDQVEIQCGDVVGVRLPVQVAVQGIARLDCHEVAGVDLEHRLDLGMIAVEAVGIVGAVRSGLGEHGLLAPLHIRGVGQARQSRRQANSSSQKATKKGVHLRPPLSCRW